MINDIELRKNKDNEYYLHLAPDYNKYLPDYIITGIRYAKNEEIAMSLLNLAKLEIENSILKLTTKDHTVASVNIDKG